MISTFNIDHRIVHTDIHPDVASILIRRRHGRPRLQDPDFLIRIERLHYSIDIILKSGRIHPDCHSVVTVFRFDIFHTALSGCDRITGIELIILTLELYQFFMCTAFYDPPLLQDHDTITVSDCTQSVCYHESGTTFHQ